MKRLSHRKPLRGYSLVEILIAILFISIGFFGYVALHARLLHSGQRLEEKEIVRASTDYFEGMETGRILIGMETSITKESFLKHPILDDLYLVKTDLSNRDRGWLIYIPEEYREQFETTMELSPRVMSKPYEYSWSKR